MSNPTAVEKIRILFLIDKLSTAGTQTNLLELVRSLDRTRFEPRVIALVEGGPLVAEFKAAGVNPKILKVRRAYGFSGMGAFFYLLRYLRRRKIDIIQTHFLHADLLGILAGRAAGVPCIITTRRDQGFWRNARQVGLMRFLSRFTDAVLANSKAVRRSVISEEGTPEEKISVVYNGIAPSLFSPSEVVREETRQELSILADQPVIGTVGNMNHEIKGQRYLLEAMPLILKKFPRTKLILVGEGKLRKSYERLATELGIEASVIFLGSRRDVQALINAVDIFVLPSLSEGFPNVVLEAMACSKPAVVTEGGGSPEIVSDGETGYLVPIRDADALAYRCLMLLRDKPFRVDMGRKARQVVMSYFTAKQMAAHYGHYYEELLYQSNQKKAGETSVPGAREPAPLAELPEASEEAALAAPGAVVEPIRRSKRVLYVIWSLEMGGAEQVVAHLAKNLDRQTFQPLVCCLNQKGTLAKDLEDCGVPVFSVGKKGPFDFAAMIRLRKLILEERVDLIHTHLFTANFWGRLAAWRTGVPVVISEHSTDTWKKPFHFLCDRLTLPMAQKVICVSQKVKEFYSEKVQGLESKACVLYNGIDPARFLVEGDREALRWRLEIDPGTVVVGIVGRLVPEKRHEDFIEVVKLLRKEGHPAMGLIVGDGPLMKELQGQVIEDGLARYIRFTGLTRRTAEMYGAMDVFILPSEREGFPLTVLEAMASEVPVVATKVGGVPECIYDGDDGRLVPPFQPKTMARVVSELIRQPDRRRSMARRARQKVSKYFSVLKMVGDHETLYKEILTGRDKR